MRKTRLLDALFPGTRQAILGAMLLEPARSWYLSDLASHLGRRNPSSLQRELDSLVAAGILARREEGNRVYFQANRECPIYPELATLLAKTSGLAEVVRRSLAPLRSKIRVAFIHGSVARSEDQATSDIDLLVVGDVGLSEVSLALRAAEQQLDRPINVSMYQPAEFASKVTGGSHFLTSVLKREKIFLTGSEHELAEIAGERPRAAARYEQAGTG